MYQVHLYAIVNNAYTIPIARMRYVSFVLAGTVFAVAARVSPTMRRFGAVSDVKNLTIDSKYPTNPLLPEHSCRRGRSGSIGDIIARS